MEANRRGGKSLILKLLLALIVSATTFTGCNSKEEKEPQEINKIVENAFKDSKIEDNCTEECTKASIEIASSECDLIIVNITGKELEDKIIKNQQAAQKKRNRTQETLLAGAETVFYGDF